MALLFGAHGEKLLALHLDFDAIRRANVAALYDGAADPRVPRKIRSSQRVVQDVGTRIADQRVTRRTEFVFIAKLRKVRDVFQFAAPVNWFAREGPITRGKARRTFGEADNRRGNLLTIQLVAEQEIDGGPGLCQIS